MLKGIGLWTMVVRMVGGLRLFEVNMGRVSGRVRVYGKSVIGWEGGGNGGLV